MHICKWWTNRNLKHYIRFTELSIHKKTFKTLLVCNTLNKERRNKKSHYEISAINWQIRPIRIIWDQRVKVRPISRSWEEDEMMISANIMLTSSHVATDVVWGLGLHLRHVSQWSDRQNTLHVSTQPTNEMIIASQKCLWNKKTPVWYVNLCLRKF